MKLAKLCPGLSAALPLPHCRADVVIKGRAVVRFALWLERVSGREVRQVHGSTDSRDRFQGHARLDPVPKATLVHSEISSLGPNANLARIVVVGDEVHFQESEREK